MVLGEGEKRRDAEGLEEGLFRGHLGSYTGQFEPKKLQQSIILLFNVFGVVSIKSPNILKLIVFTKQAPSAYHLQGSVVLWSSPTTQSVNFYSCSHSNQQGTDHTLRSLPVAFLDSLSNPTPNQESLVSAPHYGFSSQGEHITKFFPASPICSRMQGFVKNGDFLYLGCGQRKGRLFLQARVQ